MLCFLPDDGNGLFCRHVIFHTAEKSRLVSYYPPGTPCCGGLFRTRRFYCQIQRDPVLALPVAHLLVLGRNFGVFSPTAFPCRIDGVLLLVEANIQRQSSHPA